MVSIQLLILPILAAVVCAAPQGRPGVAISAPSMAGKYGAALFGQRYNENTDADRVTLNLGFKKESGQSAGSNMGSSGAYGGGGGGGMGGAPGPYGPGPGHNPFGPQGPNPGGNPYGGNPYGGNPYGPGAGAGGGGYGGMNSGGHASQYDKLGLDLGITREKGQKHASGQQQGVMVGLGRR